MFGFNIKLNKTALIIALILIVVVVTAIVIVSLEKQNSQPTDKTVINEDFSVEEYIASFGPTVNSTLCKIDEITVPMRFSDVYNSYNKIQKAQGFDLERYKGMVLTRYTYPVTNYPDKKASVFVEVLMYEGTVVAADIYSTDSDGFIIALK